MKPKLSAQAQPPAAEEKPSPGPRAPASPEALRGPGRQPAPKSPARPTVLKAAPDGGSADLTASNQSLKQGVAREKLAEAVLRRGGKRCAKLLQDSTDLQDHLRGITRQILAAQETERTKLSRRLQDDIAQTLLAINVRLLNLKKSARCDPEAVKNEIAKTQRLVAKSVKAINRFAQNLDIPQPA